MLKEYLKELQVVRCGLCNGFGHTHSKCPTGYKLRVLEDKNPKWSKVGRNVVTLLSAIGLSSGKKRLKAYK